MRATDLHPKIWNSLVNLIARSQSPREVYYVTVTKVDAQRKIIFTKDFGDIGIPLVAHSASFAYYDTQPTGVAHDGAAVTTQLVKQYDDTQTNPALRTEIIAPSVGDLVIVLDPWGAKRFPICIGVIQSKNGFWEDGS